jgi:arylsulfatase A-like enzyme/Tfp pilus assembly protein PilF
VILAAAALWQFWPRGDRIEAVRTPDQNALIVTIDTLRADALGAYGGRAATPHLDALAADGIRYDFAHAHSVVTLPSHVSILSGLYPYQHGVRDNSGYRVKTETPTLATWLNAKGFATAAFVGAFPLDSQFGLDRGFGVYDDRVNEVTGPTDFAFAERRADEVVAAALQWLRGRQGKWFLWVHVYDPHAPSRPPQPYSAQYADNLYAGEVAFTDAALGPLFQFVRDHTGRPTLVIVTGDHGEGLGDHGEQTHGVFAYEATLRIPLIVAQYANGVPAWRARSPRVSPLAVQHVDIVPTVFDALAIGAPAGLPGSSLFGLREDTARRRASYFEALTSSLNRGWAPLHGVLVNREKFIDLPLPELYDLANDPSEQANLADTMAERRRALEARLKAFGPVAPGRRQAEDADTAARLRALGYTSGTAQQGKKYTEDDDPKRLIALDRQMHAGIEAFNAGRLQDAAAIYAGLIAKRPDMGVAYLHLAFLQAELGRVNDAIATLTAARERAAPSAEIDSRLGMYLSETGQVEKAVPLLEAAAARPDAGVDALNALGIGYARAGQPAKALQVFARILERDARNVMAMQNIGSVHLAAGNLAEARSAFERAIGINPAWAATYTGLGALEAQSGNRPAAIAAWQRAIELNPSDFDALFNLATELINARQPAAARPYVERFVRTAPRAAYGPDIARLEAYLRAQPSR